MLTMKRLVTVSALAVAAFGLSGISDASAEKVHLKAALSGKSQVPPNDSKGAGTGTMTYDTASKELSWSINYKGLKAPAAAAHFHGPADATASAGVVLPFADPKSPIKGKATLTDAQAADLLAGKWYVNVHSPAFPAGEIRGQVMAPMKKAAMKDGMKDTMKDGMAAKPMARKASKADMAEMEKTKALNLQQIK